MYHTTDTHLFRETETSKQIKKDYPIQDETWASRRWNKDRTLSCDLSGGHDVICQDCHDEEELLNIIEFIKEKADTRGWGNAVHLSGEKFGMDKTQKAMKLIYEQDTYVDRWISIEEKKPNYFSTNLVIDGDGNQYNAHRVSDGDGDYYVITKTDNIVEIEITHWQPLPKPPKTK
jgi:hypothetical protein